MAGGAYQVTPFLSTGYALTEENEMNLRGYVLGGVVLESKTEAGSFHQAGSISEEVKETSFGCFYFFSFSRSYA